MHSARLRLLTEQDIVERAELRRQRWSKLRLIAALILVFLLSFLVLAQVRKITAAARSLASNFQRPAFNFCLWPLANSFFHSPLAAALAFSNLEPPTSNFYIYESRHRFRYSRKPPRL